MDKSFVPMLYHSCDNNDTEIEMVKALVQMRRYKVRLNYKTRSLSCLSILILIVANALVLTSVHPVAGAPFDPWSSGWAYRKQITIDHAKVSATLTNFPVLIDATSNDLKPPKVRSDGYDILFMDGTGSANMLDHEIESYTSATGHLVAWVRIPTLSSTVDTIIYIYYGNSGAGNQQNPTGVWDSSFMMVQHLKETSGTHYDSTSHHNDGTPAGGVSQGVAGKIDGADNFDGVDDRIDVAHDNSLNFGTGDFTISVWIKYTNCIDTDITRKGNMASSPQMSYKMEVGSNIISGTLEGSNPGGGGTVATSTTYNDNNWHNAVFMRQTGTISLYVDGAQKATQGGAGMDLTSTASVAIGAKPPPISPGGDYFTGMIDEVRYSNVASGANWILTSYRSATEQFVTYAAEEQQSGTTCTVTFYSDPTSGTITADGVSKSDGSTGTYSLGARVHVIANSPSGYAFYSWEVSGVSVDSTSSPDTYMTVSSDGWLKAHMRTVYDFTFVWMTDTQLYAASYPSVFDSMTQWIVDNKDSMKIQYVIHTGDIIDTPNDLQYQRADHSMAILDNANVPNGVLAGNHEELDSFVNYHNYFGAQRYQGRSYYHDYGNGYNDNHYDLISASGVNLVIVYLSIGTDTTERAWASGIFQTYSDRIGILAVHEYISTGGGYSGDGSALYSEVVEPNDNVWLILCGHVLGAQLNVKTAGSRTYYEVLSDYQGLSNGGNGYQKIFYFDLPSSKVYAKTYSVELGQFGGSSYSYDEFEMALPQLQPPTTPTVTVTGAYHGARLIWNNVGALSYNIYYNTVNNPDTATQFTTGVAALTYDVKNLPSSTWGATCYFWIAPVTSGGETPKTSWGLGQTTPPDKIWAYKVEVTNVVVTEKFAGSISVSVQYRSRYFESGGITVGLRMGEYLGPGTVGNIPNQPMTITTSSPISLTSFMSAGSFNFGCSSGQITSGSSYKAWIFLWNQLPSDPGFWESYSAKYEENPITIP